MDREQRILLQKAQKKVDKGHFPFYGFSLALMSVIYGAYVYFNGGYLVKTIDIRFNFITEEIISMTTILAGLIKLAGIAFNSGLVKRIGIVLLSFVWGVVFTLATVWALGVGYPAPTFIIYGFVLAICLRVSYKGDFG